MQAAYHLSKPSILKTHLLNIGVDEEKVRTPRIMSFIVPPPPPPSPGTSVLAGVERSRKGSGREAAFPSLLPQTGVCSASHDCHVMLLLPAAGGGQLAAELANGAIVESKDEDAQRPV